MVDMGLFSNLCLLVPLQTRNAALFLYCASHGLIPIPTIGLSIAGLGRPLQIGVDSGHIDLRAVALPVQ